MSPTRHPLLLKVTAVLAAGSLLLALALGGWQLQRLFHRQQRQLARQLADLYAGQGPSLAHDLWTVDREALAVQVASLAAAPGIRRLEVADPTTGILASAGGPPTANPAFHRTYTLTFDPGNGPQPVGTLTVDGDYEGLVTDFRHTALWVLAGQLLVVFATAAVALALLVLLVGRHLTVLARHAESLALDNLDHPLVLPRLPWLRRWPDELDKIAGAWNRMQERLAQGLAARRAAEQALAAEQERLAVTLESIGDGVICTDTQARITLMNHTAEDLTGWQRDQALGRPLAEVFAIVREKDGRPQQDPVAKVLAQGKIVGLANHTLLVRRDGTRLAIADSGAPIRGTDGSIIGVVLVFRDAEEERRREAERLQLQKLESVGVLAGGIAHDFNNLLTAILGAVNLAQLELANQRPHQAATLLADAEKATMRASRLTTQLLTFAKGGAPIRRPTQLAEVIRDCAEFTLRGSPVRLVCHLAADLWPAQADGGQIGQVIQNLVQNGREAMAEGGTLEITGANVQDPEEMEQPGRYLRITVRDTGPGIPADVLPRIFDPYFTTKEHGHGLGLAVAHAIVTKHDGRLLVTSQPGQGTTFTILLPAADTEPAPPPVAEHLLVQRDTAKGRVLLLDDEDQVREVGRRMLEFLGYRVTAVADGAAAVEAWQQALAGEEGFAAGILDLTIAGGMGGAATAQQILALDPNARLFVASGYANDPILAQHRAHGFAGAIAKPFRLADLQAHLQG